MTSTHTLKTNLCLLKNSIFLSIYFCLFLFLSVLPSSLLQATETGPPNPYKESIKRYDYGLDVHLMTLYNRSAFNVGNPTMVFGAQWLKRFFDKPYGGLSLAVTPLALKAEKNQSTLDVSFFEGGLTGAYPIVEHTKWHLQAALSFSYGNLWVRIKDTPEGRIPLDSSYQKITPHLYGTFYRFHDLEFGISLAYHIAMLKQPLTYNDVNYGENKDVSGLSFGITARTFHL